MEGSRLNKIVSFGSEAPQMRTPNYCVRMRHSLNAYLYAICSIRNWKTSWTNDLVSHGQDDLSFLKVIGNRLEKITYLDYDEVSSDATQEWDLCPNLVDMSIVGRLEVKEVRAIFNRPKMYLKRLDIIHIYGVVVYKDIAQEVE